MRLFGFTTREMADVVTLALAGAAAVMLLACAAVIAWRAL